MKKKPNLRDLIDKNLKLILGIIGFISGIAMFIAAVRLDFYLYSTVVGILLLIGGMIA